MDLPVLIFLSGVGATLMVAASLAFTIYEVRRTNPHAFKPKSQDELASGP
jgi:uncharacterized membrane protein